MAKKKREYKLKINDLPDGLSKEDIEKVRGGVLSSLSTQLNLSKLALSKVRGDCDCWSYTACACKCAS